MKSRLFFGLVMATALLMSSCDTESIRASDEISTVEYSFSGYNGLQVSGDFEAFVTFSNGEERIEIQANENLQDKIIVTKDGSTLKIRMENNINVRGNATLKAYITTSEISNFITFGNSLIELENLLVTDNLFIEASGNSWFSGNVDAERLTVTATGNSVLDIYGLAKSINAKLAGNSLMRDYDLFTDDLILTMSGDSDTFLSVSKTIDVDASGNSELNYKGDAEVIRERLSGNSKVRKRD
ncbi:head GIN domain-containing protein [Flagellimonas meishanensis]|uniref:head GIN domain-containing protein n=1 Tax=Flagellimonas meishanensis TaxID=2873264 RepID=UPI001CA72B55|nr:head GIN domain-containing protein [[Muricauda] meishanensis]